VVAIGVGLASYLFRSLPGSTLAYLGSVMLLAGAVLWSIHCYLRFQDPSAFVAGSLPGWHFLVYTFLTMAGLVLFGYMLVGSEIRNWVGWMLIIGNVAFLILMLVFKDMPPFVYYVLTLISGIVMVL